MHAVGPRATPWWAFLTINLLWNNPMPKPFFFALSEIGLNKRFLNDLLQDITTTTLSPSKTQNSHKRNPFNAVDT
jgi:hypothetical protein